MIRLVPERPRDAGIELQVPELAQIEGARLLANQARSALAAAGFSTDEVVEWALTYIAVEGCGDVASFIEWIQTIELVHGDVN